jgi:hypothetical protein
MKSRVGLVSSVLALALLSTPRSASATELHEGASPLSVTVPDGWSISVDGAWALADAPDHTARVRIATHGTGVLADLAAEAYLINFIADSWATYTVDKHVRHVQCGRYIGLELYGHGSGDTWSRAKFHLYLLIDPGSPQKGAVVLISGREDAWDAAHPPLDRAVHALHGG